MSPIKKNKSISTKQLLNQSVAEICHYINKCWSIEIAWLLTWAGEISWYAVDEQFGLIGKCIHDVSAGIRRIQAQGNICSFEDSYESRSDLTDYEALCFAIVTEILDGKHNKRRNFHETEESNVFKRMDFQKIHRN